MIVCLSILMTCQHRDPILLIERTAANIKRVVVLWVRSVVHMDPWVIMASMKTVFYRMTTEVDSVRESEPSRLTGRHISSFIH